MVKNAEFDFPLSQETDFFELDGGGGLLESPFPFVGDDQSLLVLKNDAASASGLTS